MNWACFIGISLFATISFNVRAQPLQLTAFQNSPLFFPATDLTTNGVDGLTNTSPQLMVSSVSPVSTQLGSVSLVNTQVWVQSFNYNAYSHAIAFKVVIDQKQNVIVTGSSSTPASSDDFLTIKYASDGTPLWTNRWDGPAHLQDEAEYLAVDAYGNVYVAGMSEVTAATWNAVAIKYSADGKLLWASHYNRDGTNYCAPAGLAVDADGNVLITASIAYATTAYIAVKYDPLGNAVWTNYYKGSTSGSDWAAAMRVDNDGNIFVTGDSDGDGTGLNYATLKYAPDGTAVWTNRYINGWTAIPSAMTLDPDGNVIVTGDSMQPTHQYATVKYSKEGIPLWTNIVPAPNYQGGTVPCAVADNAGNVFVTGGSPGADATNTAFTTEKLSAAGLPLWTNSFCEINFDSSQPVSTAVDSAGNFYFAGHASGPGGTNYNFVTIKYASAGDAVWTNRYGGITPGTWNVAEDLVVDYAGHVVVVGGSGAYWSMSGYATVKYSDFICYTPPTNFIGTDSFTFTTVDPLGNRATNVVTVVVLPANLQFNTDPANLWRNSEGMHLRVDGARGTNEVIIDASTNLMNWEPVFTNQPAQGSVQFTDPAATGMPQRFYRAIQQP
jgi:hypothetical protein